MHDRQSEPLAETGQPDTPADVRAPVLVAIPGPARQHRLTVAFRLILAIPQAIVLGFLGIAALAVAVIGWVAALFTGRLPTFAASFLGGYLRWQIRYSCYLYLLTGVYPPFSLEEEGGYPVHLAIQPGRLNRLAVLFRLVLGIPAYILAVVAGYGLQLVLIVAWLIALVSGRLPAALHQAIAAVVRYGVRFTGYMFLLTAEYPWGLFGDRAEDQEPAAADAAAAEAEPGYAPWEAAPDYGPAGEEVLGYGPGEAAPGYAPAEAASGDAVAPPVHGDAPAEAEPGYAPAEAAPGDELAEAAPGDALAAAPGEGQAPATGPDTPPGLVPATPPAGGPVAADQPSWRLVLSSGGKRLVTVVLAVGVLLVAAAVTVPLVAAGGAVSRQEAVREVRSAHARLISATQAFASRAAACRSTTNPLPCVERADRTVAKAFGDFGQAVRGIGMPTSSSSAAASHLASAASQVERDLRQLSESNSIPQYEQRVQSSNLQQILAELDQDYQQLGIALNTRL